MKKLEQFLKDHRACKDGLEFARDLTLEESLNTCERGDWILWLFQRMNPSSLKELTLAKAHCANTIRHLMKDERSLNAVDVAMKFGRGEASRKELDTAAFAASDASADAFAAAAASAAAFAAAEENQKLTADICREYLPLSIWNQNFNN